MRSPVLQAFCLCTIACVETVAVEEDGSLLMLDKYNYVWHASADAAAPGGYRLADRPINYLGTGRPLGFKKDAQGNLIVCNSNQ
eukprot:scaffold52880_cov20-Tisochrysis_lutea.AAC.1